MKYISDRVFDGIRPISPERLAFFKTRKECQHEWVYHSRDGDYHDLYGCAKCGKLESRSIQEKDD